MNEEWKWINGYEGEYQISNLGRLKSFKRYEEGYILSNTNCKGDYLRVVLKDFYGNTKNTRIHVLVAEHFIGEIPRGWHVHHKDGNKQNNVYTNLEIIHPKNHRKETEKQKPQITTGIVNYNKFIKTRTIYQYDLDGNWIASYCNAEFASEFTGVCARNILQVANKTPYGKNNKIRSQAGGYVWKFADECEVINK